MTEPTEHPRRKTGGRQKGSRNKRSKARTQAAERTVQIVEEFIPEAFRGDAHALLIAVYKDTKVELHIRLDAAKTAIQYEKGRAIYHAGPGGGPVHLHITADDAGLL